MDKRLQQGPSLNKYYTVMTPLPAEFNREQVLSLVNSNSDVKSLTLLKMKALNGTIKRIGLVGVDDDESLFRLTSRRFMVQGVQLTHKKINPESKLLMFLVRRTLPLILRFYSTNRRATSQVFDFFSRFGELEWVGLKASNGNHELSLNAHREFSIREHTTDLHIMVEDIWVQIEYPVETVSLQYFENDLGLFQDFRKASEEAVGPVSEKANFFETTLPRNDIASDKTFKHQEVNPYFKDSQFTVDNDDNLSQDDEEEMFEVRKSGAAILDQPIAQKRPLEFFEIGNTGAFLSRYGVIAHNSIKPDLNLSQVGSLKRRAAITKHKNCVMVEPDALEEMSSNFQITLSKALVSSPHKCGSKARKVINKAVISANKQITSLSLPVSTYILQNNSKKKATALMPNAFPKLVPQTVSISIPSREVASEGPSNIPGNDGSELLLRLQPSCLDLEVLNNKFMPEIHCKWRRFVEIKDAMRREKYTEYLLNKKRERQAEAANDGELEPYLYHKGKAVDSTI